MCCCYKRWTELHHVLHEFILTKTGSKAGDRASPVLCIICSKRPRVCVFIFSTNFMFSRCLPLVMFRCPQSGYDDDSTQSATQWTWTWIVRSMIGRTLAWIRNHFHASLTTMDRSPFYRIELWAAPSYNDWLKMRATRWFGLYENGASSHTRRTWLLEAT